MGEPVRYYFDQHVRASVARGLRREGIDVLTAGDAGRCGHSDEDQLAFATADERVVVTFDPDFLALHQSGIGHAGISWCPERKYDIGELIAALQLVHGVLDRESMRNHVEYL